MSGPEYLVQLPSSRGHQQQQAFIDSVSKRIIVRAGRRGGKTVGASIKAISRFMQGRRILYAAPATEQVGRFWATVCAALAEPLAKGVLRQNNTEHIIELRGTETRIKAKSAWNADTLRGDYADLLILDEWQLMNEDAWELVGAPMLLDNNGDAIFIYTPPSLHSRSVSKANDPQHAAKMFARAKLEEQNALKEGRPSRWQTFHFSSMDNPYISKIALQEITQDMTSLAYRMEILAQDINEAPGALWTRDIIERNRSLMAPAFDRVVVGVDPSATSTGDEAGIIGAGVCAGQGYLLEDASVQGSPLAWAAAAVTLYHKLKADRIVAEANNGGEMVEAVIKQVDENVPVKLVHASRGKQTRAEPISAKYEKDRVHHVGKFEKLEDEMCLWIPGDASPNRMDAMVWAFTDLLLTNRSPGVRIMDAEPDPMDRVLHKCWMCGDTQECVLDGERFYCADCYREKKGWDELDDDD